MRIAAAVMLALVVTSCTSNKPRGPRPEVIDRILTGAPGEAQPSRIVAREVEYARAARETGQRAVVVSSLPETFPLQARQRMRDAGIAPMQGIEDCLFAIHAAATMGIARENIESIQPVRKCAKSVIDKEPRTLERPSDHAPVWLEFG